MTAASLEPVREEIVRQARADADAAVARAEAEAAEKLEQARTEAAAILDEARAGGEAEANRALRVHIAQARLTARTVELEARRQVYETWRNAVRDRIHGLRRSAEYPALMSRLADHARALLGEAAVIEEDPRGGLRAHAGNRRLDLTLDAVADRAIARAEGQAAELWTK